MRTYILAAVVGAMALSGCASTGGIAKMQGEAAQYRYVDYAGEPIDDFRSFRLDGWAAVSRDTLVLWNGVNEAYLVKVWDNCRDLNFANVIGVTSTTNTISKFEKVRVGNDVCPISEIRPIDVKQMKADRRAAMAASKAATAEQ
ncbi:MAG TPA: DUF6491 family protein [Steroidobacteraceae bacterium]|nr:DUF6491 family protein [Steroidobacteraceae bacterium]HRX90836.1 DUF6491 family protein [Steroidobacteraceae bacterium]